MRITHFLSSLAVEWGGVPRFAMDVCHLLAQRGHHATILTTNATDAPPEWIAPTHPEQANPSPPPPGTPRILVAPPSRSPKNWLSSDARALCEREIANADVLHLHGMFEFSVAQVSAIARKHRVPYVLSPHGMLDDWCLTQRRAKKLFYLRTFARAFIRGAARVHLTAQREFEQTKSWYDPARAVVAPCPIDLDAYASLPGPTLAEDAFPFLKDHSTPIALFLGRVNYKKGPDLLIHAVAHLARRHRPVRAVIAGMSEPDDYIRELTALADSLNIGSLVHFAGPVRGATKLSLYQRADVFALPSSQENFGLVLIESLACHTPVITTPGVDIWEELQATGAADIVPRDPVALADAIERIAHDPARRAAMSARARPWVLEAFQPARISEHYESLYRSAIGHQRK